MAKPQEGDTVKVHYTGRVVETGEEFDSTEEDEPLEFTIGSDNVIPGFEEIVKSLEEGESETREVKAKDAYGSHRDDMIAQVEKENFPDDIDLEQGMTLQLPQPDGEYVPVKVIEVNEDTVTIDGNHELADQDLEFEVTLIEIEE